MQTSSDMSWTIGTILLYDHQPGDEVATSAFGMGMTKSNVRFVIALQHAEEHGAYYQEAGRAGQDGEPAGVMLLWRPGRGDQPDLYQSAMGQPGAGR